MFISTEYIFYSRHYLSMVYKITQLTLTFLERLWLKELKHSDLKIN